ncbi:probable cytochrome P450 9f2 [Topomyia yanbarensis]|uniref:probable cytochrome P450 9f2 n=1 Tax=Topomyia yanbarensis TaxID=2498891 RepID=UPI00273BF4D5|nr:probable cytochrome P450 9f2 [Topomyia yanbarensis]
MEVDLFLAGAIGALILLFYYYVAKKYEYFQSTSIPCVKPTFLLGSSGPTMFRTKDVTAHMNSLYYTYPESKMIGFFDLMSPMFMVRDPDIIKRISIKDFDHFVDHTPSMSNAATDEEIGGESLFGNSVFALRGQKWRDMRATLSPAFTGSKMRHMFELVAECSKSAIEFLTAEAKSGKRLEYEMKDIFSRFCNDVIASVAFGVKIDSLREPENVFYQKGKHLLTDGQSLWLVIKVFLIKIVPKLSEKLNVEFVNADLAKYFKKMIEDNMEQRKSGGIVRNDMIQLLMEVQKGTLQHQKEDQESNDASFAAVHEPNVGKSTHSRVWTENELIAQCFVFFFAGFDTVSTCMAFLTYELTINPDIQNRLYAEILQTEQSLNGASLTYETLQKMEYLDMVVSETLRKWPPAVVTERFCTKDYHYDDGAGTRFDIKKEQTVLIPTISIQNDAKYFPDPERFDPERFSRENRAKINTGAYIPFGVGPRNCIGLRLALMEVKMIVYYLLKDFGLEPTEKTQIPLRIAKNLFSLEAEKGIWVELKNRDA